MNLGHFYPTHRVGRAPLPPTARPAVNCIARDGRRRRRQLHGACASPHPPSSASYTSPVIDIAGVPVDEDDDDSDDDDGWGPDEDGWGDATGDDDDDPNAATTPPLAFAPRSPTNPPAWGPRAVALAGFPSPETALVRSILDRLGLADAKVLPLTTADLGRPAAAALTAPERDWAAPAPPEESGLGSGWGVGAPRVAVFGGLTADEQAGVLAALDAAGLPMVGGVAVEAGTATGEPLGVAVAAAAAAARADRLAGRGPQQQQQQQHQAASTAMPDFARGVVDAASLPDAAELVARAGVMPDVEVVGGEEEAEEEEEGAAPPDASSTAARAAGLPTDWQAVAAAAGPAFMADLAANTTGVGGGRGQVEDDEEDEDEEEEEDGQAASPTGALPPSLLDVVVATSLAGEAAQPVRAAAPKQPAPPPPAKARRGFGARPAATAGTTAAARTRPAPPPPPPSMPNDDAEVVSAYLAAAAPKSGKDALATAAAKKKKAERKKAAAAAAVVVDDAKKEEEEAGPPPPAPPQPSPTPTAVMAEPVGLSGDESAAHARIVADLDAKFRKKGEGESENGKAPDQAALSARMRAEAEAPTRDAIEAAISCGLTVEEIVAMAKAAAELKEEGAKGLAVPWSKMPRLLDPTPTEVGERDAPGRGHDGLEAGGPASELSEEELEALARARGLALPPRE